MAFFSARLAKAMVLFSFMMVSVTSFAHEGENTPDTHDDKPCAFCLLVDREDEDRDDDGNFKSLDKKTVYADQLDLISRHHLLANSPLVLKISEDAVFLFAHSRANHLYEVSAVSARAPPFSL